MQGYKVKNQDQLVLKISFTLLDVVLELRHLETNA